jgi:hypothetical protein
MIKLKSLLHEAFADVYPKNKYITLKSKDISDYADELIDLIDIAYKEKGGNLELKSAGDLRNSDLTYWIAKDFDDDPNIDIAIGGKKTKYGTKLTVLGQDGERQSRKESIQQMIKLMKTKGFYAEMDSDLAEKFGLAIINDENLIQRVLNKEIKFHSDGTYDRKIQGEYHTKVLVGIPKVK